MNLHSPAAWVHFKALNLIHSVLKAFPVRQGKIVFANFLGRGMGGSPKYIAEEILREGLPYDLVWLAENPDIKFPKGIRSVKMYSLRGRYELATANVIVNNVKHKLPFKKKKTGQCYIQTWHGDFALKFIEKEVENKLDPLYVAESKADSKETDLILSGSRQFTEIARNAFWYDGEIFECGVPCNDPLFSLDDSALNAVRAMFGIPEGTGIALYAPTFRDGDDNHFEIPDFEAVVNRLERISGHPWTLLVRFHPLDQQQLERVSFSERVLNGSAYPDSQDLTKAADLLITDYSSIMYDFILQHKKGIIFAPDVERYERTRGLRNIFWEVPFPITQTEETLIQSIDDLFEPTFPQRLDDFLKNRIHSFDDGHASERVVSRIKDFIGRTGTYPEA